MKLKKMMTRDEIDDAIDVGGCMNGTQILSYILLDIRDELVKLNKKEEI